MYKRQGQTVEQIERDSDRDRWFAAEEAKDYGHIDHVARSAGQVDGSGGTDGSGGAGPRDNAMASS